VEERKEEREEAGCKLTASLDTKTKKLYERDKWSHVLIVNSELLYEWAARRL